MATDCAVIFRLCSKQLKGGKSELTLADFVELDHETGPWLPVDDSVNVDPIHLRPINLATSRI
jgi:hypothetical protein